MSQPHVIRQASKFKTNGPGLRLIGRGRRIHLPPSQPKYDWQPLMIVIDQAAMLRRLATNLGLLLFVLGSLSLLVCYLAK